jgi:hypothetical protein
VLDGQLPERDITRGMRGFSLDKLYEGTSGMEEPTFNRLAPDEPLSDEDRPGHRLSQLQLRLCSNGCAVNVVPSVPC